MRFLIIRINLFFKIIHLIKLFQLILIVIEFINLLRILEIFKEGFEKNYINIKSRILNFIYKKTFKFFSA